ncbi:MAG: hypothetical protein H6Q81_2606 [Deltaproteobacteria bacterium]|nr:hypothetical protein [Deltaproteobacteria bacterium]
MEQLGLFGRPRAGDSEPRAPVDPGKREKVNRAMDRIREKFGPGGIVPGALPERKTRGE